MSQRTFGRVKVVERAVDVAGRTPPSNVDAEEAVISTLLTHPGSVDEVATIVAAADFYADAHRRIFEAALDLHSNGQPIDVQTVGAWLSDRQQLSAVGGIAYISRIIDATPAIANVAAHAKIVASKARVRRLIETCQIAAAEGYGDYGEADEFVDRVAQRVHELADVGREQNDAQIYDVVRTVFEQDVSAQGQGCSVTGIHSGFTAIDERTTGMHPGELIVVAARPGMGKTAYAMAIAAHVAREPDPVINRPRYGVGVFSLEMPKEQLVRRMVASDSRVDIRRLRKGDVRGDDWDRYVSSSHAVSQLPVWIDDQPEIDLLHMRARIRRWQRSFHHDDESGRPAMRLGLVIVDYLQLMAGKGDNREQEIASVSRGLKRIAKEMSIPIIALAQLNRGVEGRADKRPQLSDLRESGAIEQDADVVQGLYRPAYYAEAHNERVKENEIDLVEVSTLKQRNGPTGVDSVAFRDFCARFENPTPKDSERWNATSGAEPPKARAPKAWRSKA